MVSHRLHVRAYQRVFHWRILETMYWELVWKSVEKILICVKSDNNIGHFTRRPKHTCVVNNNTKCFVSRQGCKGNLLLYFDGRNQAAFHCWQLIIGQKQYKVMALLLLHSSERTKIYLMPTLPVLIAAPFRRLIFGLYLINILLSITLPSMPCFLKWALYCSYVSLVVWWLWWCFMTVLTSRSSHLSP